jgi:DNA-binding GntR family transcriptional regulator
MRLEGRSLDRDSPVPLYAQIAGAIEASIGRGELTPGQLLDAETELARRLKVSRPTVRAAMSYLAQRGLIVKKRGVGSLVAERRHIRDIRVNLYDHLVSTGRKPTTTVLAFDLVPCPEEVRDRFELQEGDVLRIERLRYADGVPIALMLNHVMVPDLGINREDLERDGLYPLLRDRAIRVTSIAVRLEARDATDRETELLEMAEGEPVLHQLRDGFDGFGRLIDHGSHVYPGNRYAFEATLPSD